MALSEREKIISGIVQDYTEQGYEVLGIDEGYPGILDKPVPEHELEGRTDILLSDPEYIEGLRVIEVACTGSLDSEVIEERYLKNIEQARKSMQYFENLGYEVNPEAVLRPEGDLKLLKEVWDNTTGVFTWGALVDSVSEPGRLGKMKEEGKIIFEAPSSTGSELYSLSEELDDVVDLFYRKVI